MLRRLKTDVLRELPDKLESIVYAPLEGEQLRLYAAHEQRLREELTAQRKNKNDRSFDQRKVEVLAELTKLRQLCCDPRLLYENYERARPSSMPSWSSCPPHGTPARKRSCSPQFTSFLDRIAERLDAAGVGYFTITGATPKKRRLALVNAFNADDHARVPPYRLRRAAPASTSQAPPWLCMPTPGGTPPRRTRPPTARIASGRIRW